MSDAIFAAIGLATDPFTVIILMCGVLFGTIIGALPGLGSVLALTVCLPFTLVFSSATAFALMLGTYCGAIYGGSISAILINTPGTPQSAATNLDGYPMARMGLAGEALGWATAASVTGGIISCIILVFATSRLAEFSLMYGGPLEICALICLGLSCIATLSEGNELKGLMMGVFGLFLSTIGMDSVSSEMRFTFGSSSLATGIDLLPFVVGLFPLSEVFYRIYEINNAGCVTCVECKRMILPTLRQYKEKLWVLIRSSLIGTGIGILPGTGAAPATFISYSVARSASKNGHRFGHGEAEGIAAAEAANNSVTGGAMVPTLALGIPGDAETSLMLVALTIHQITPGVRLMSDHPEMVYCIFILLIVANLLMIPAGKIVVRSFGRLLRIPQPVLLGMIVMFSMLGAFITRNNFFDLWAALFIGVCAFGFRLGNFPLPPCLIGYILGPQLEYRFSQAVVFKGEEAWIPYLCSHPLAMILMAIVIILMLKPFLRRAWKAWKQQAD